MQMPPNDLPLSRRHWIAGAAVTASGLMLAGASTARAADSTAPGAAPAPASADMTPEQALKRLLDGNQRFISDKSIEPNRSLARLRETEGGQAPFAAVLSCADSRVPVEILFDQGFGDVFVVRVAGNVVTPEEIASLEFGTLVLGARALLVLGHTACGAVKAAIAGQEVPGQISTLFQHITPAIDAAGTNDLTKVTHANVRLQVKNLTRGSTVVSRLVREGKLLVVGAVYDIGTGVVTPVEMS